MALVGKDSRQRHTRVSPLQQLDRVDVHLELIDVVLREVSELEAAVHRAQPARRREEAHYDL